jgi:hypothetical protein
MLASDHLIELFNERAAIMEHCGGMKKADAEWESYLELKKLVGRTKEGNAVQLPAEIVKTVKIAKQQKFSF